MKRVLRYTPPFNPIINLSLPWGAKLVLVDKASPHHYAETGNPVSFWFEVDDSRSEHIRSFFVVGTGFEIPKGAGDWMTSVNVDGYIWHIYEKVS